RRRAVHVGLVLIGCAAALAALWLAREILLLGFLGVLIAVEFSFPVGWLSRVVPRGMAVLLVLVALVGAGIGIAALAAPTLQREVDERRERDPQAVKAFHGWLSRVQPCADGKGRP